MKSTAPREFSLSFLSRINLDCVKEHLKRFAVLDSDKDGRMSLKDFALHYKLPASSPVKELFSIFDRVRLKLMHYSYRGLSKQSQKQDFVITRE